MSIALTVKYNVMVITMNVLKPILNKNLNSPEIINQFAEDFIFLQNKWSQLTYEQRISNIVEMVSKAQKSIGVPAGKVEPNAESGHAGEFFNENWLIRVDSKLLKNNVIFPENAEELALTLYHEIRHIAILN